MLLFLPQASFQLKIPREHHRFILGKSGKKLQELELVTATKISIPRVEENNDLIKISGTKEGIETARHEIEVISEEQVSAERATADRYRLVISGKVVR